MNAAPFDSEQGRQLVTMDSMPSPKSANVHTSETERIIASLWAEVLDTENLPQGSDNFFDFGGDSIAMVAVLFRIQEELSIELPPGAMLEAPSLQALASLVDTAKADLLSGTQANEPSPSAQTIA